MADTAILTRPRRPKTFKLKNIMKSTIDQISFNAEKLTYTLFISISGNQHQINITHDNANTLINSNKVLIEQVNNITYWIF